MGRVSAGMTRYIDLECGSGNSASYPSSFGVSARRATIVEYTRPLSAAEVTIEIPLLHHRAQTGVLPMAAMNIGFRPFYAECEIRLFFVAFLLPHSEPSIGKTDSPAMHCHEWLKHSAGGRCRDTGVNKWALSHHPGRNPKSPGRDVIIVAFRLNSRTLVPGAVIPGYRLRVISNITIGFVGQICQIFFTGLCLCKASTYGNRQSSG